MKIDLSEIESGLIRSCMNQYIGNIFIDIAAFGNSLRGRDLDKLLALYEKLGFGEYGVPYWYEEKK